MPLNALARSVSRRIALITAVVALALVSGERLAAQGVNPSLIKLSYRCGNWFRLRSTNSVDVPLSYAVFRTSETGTVTLPAAPPSIGYSETWVKTQNRGALLVSYNGNRVAEKPNGNAACAAAASAGQWTAPIPWQLMAIHSHLLPNGQVLMWGREHADTDGYTIPTGKTNGVPTIWDPATGGFTIHDAHADLFCSGHSFLADGRLMEAGGSDDHDGLGQRFAWIFDYRTNSWTRTPNMLDGRWYPTVVTLASGNTFVISGSDTASNIDSIPETYNVASNSWTEMTGLKAKVQYWAWLFAAPNGQLFYAGDRDDFTYYMNTSGTGSGGAGFRPNVSMTRDYGSAVMYDAGKILIVGGGNPPSDGSTAETIDLNQGTPSWTQIPSMHAARRQMNAVLMADGKIMASGGAWGAGFNPSTNISYTPEVWDPANPQQPWVQMANYQVARLYHSETLLLTDGRILSVGGGQPAASGLSDNFNAEIYSPTYLFNPDGSAVATSRPIITAAPTSVGYNSNFQLTVQNVAAGTAKVLWIRLGSVTHAINMNQRLNHLASSQSGQTLTVTTPTNQNLAPPGHYQVFVLNANGVPSKSVIVQIQ